MGSDVSALRASLEKTRELARHLEEIREEERNNIAQALHEGIAQDLFAAKLLLDYLKARALTGETGDQKVVWRQLGEAIATCMESTRDIANQLRPTAPAHWDITAAIAEHAHRIESVSGFTITVREATPLPALAPAIRSLFFSAAREALTLIIQLAAATIVDITLSAQGNIVTLEVKDDGSGVDAEAADGTRSHEFVRIRGRFEALGGGLNVTHTAQGTRFRAQTPISFV
jgi:signal transduction histidine kinase